MIVQPASPRPVGLLTKLRALGPSEWLALSEAMTLITIAAPVIKFTPLKKLGRIFSAPTRGEDTDPANRALVIERVAWAVDRAAKRSKLRALCFERGLTAQIMLRRRGIDATMFYGLMPGKDAPLDAHVWVAADGIDVTGGANASLYATLATFPPGREAHPMPKLR